MPRVLFRDALAQRLRLGAQRGQVVVLSRCGGRVAPERAGLEGAEDLLGRQRRMIGPRLLDLALEEGVAAARMATSEEDAGASFLEDLGRAVGPLRGVGLAVGSAVAVERDASVHPVDRGDMDE